VISNLSVARISTDAVEISWIGGTNGLEVSIFVGDSPDSFDGGPPAVRVVRSTCAEILGLDPEIRYYFRVVPEGGPGIITAERRVPLDGAVNFRDLGGYETLDGRQVKWGQIFRSDSLARLTGRDQAVLKRMGIRLACDFRTPAEVNVAPDRLPDDGSVKYLHLPIIQDDFDSVSALKRMKKGDIRWLTRDFMVNGYIKNIDDFADKWGMVINHLAESDSLPLVFHCTGGKDRAGTCAALILLALGVPEETVIYDHGLSNEFIAKWLKKIYDYMRAFGINPEKVAPYFTAPREGMVSLLDHIRRAYGSATNYLKTKGGVRDETLSRLKQALLE